jgi:enamine deaminase RidA (YjgF/YER057c/UK114 family)
MLKKLYRRMRATGTVVGADGAPRERERLRRWAVRPDGWKAPRGYENGILVEGGGRLLFVAGQIAWDADQRLVGEGSMSKQFVQALDNVLAVVADAGGRPEEIVRMTVYVTDKQAYLEATAAIGEAWRDRIGSHYPAMALVQVADLLEEGALVEIEATAVIG